MKGSLQGGIVFGGSSTSQPEAMSWASSVTLLRGSLAHWVQGVSCESPSSAPMQLGSESRSANTLRPLRVCQRTKSHAALRPPSPGMLAPMCIRVVFLLAAFRGAGAGGGGGRGRGSASSSSDWANRANEGTWHGGDGWSGGSWGRGSWWQHDDRWSNGDDTASSSSWTNIPDPSAVPVLNRRPASSVAADHQVEGTDEGKGSGKGEPSTNGLECSKCRTKLRSSEAVIDAEWQGRLWVRCYDCWEPSDQGIAKCKKAFERERRNSWASRKSNARMHKRGIEMSKQFELVQREANESVREWKKRSITTIARAFFGLRGCPW